MQSMSIVEPRCSSTAVNGKSHHVVQWLLVTFIVILLLDHICDLRLYIIKVNIEVNIIRLI